MVKKNRRLMGGYFALPEDIAATMVALSQATTATIRRSSFVAMLSSIQGVGHFSWSHLVPHTAAQPQEPDASEDIWIEANGLGAKIIPFHVSARRSHHIRSALAVAFRRRC